MRRQCFEALVARLHAAVLRDRRVGRVEVVPHRDPLEAMVLDATPQRLELGGGGVLKSCMDAEVHDREPRARVARASNAPFGVERGGVGAEPYSGRMLEVDVWPELRDPVLVLALSGWVDAGMAGAHSSALLREQLGASRAFARLDLSDLVDLQQTRPMVGSRGRPSSASPAARGATSCSAPGPNRHCGGHRSWPSWSGWRGASASAPRTASARCRP